jgi:NADP-dependent 3-hydroxy acid dehydrogenase YdfG
MSQAQRPNGNDVLMSFPTPNFSVDLSRQTALVTGASSGLGRRFALALAAAGAQVVLGARRVDHLERLTAEIRSFGGEALALSLDVTDEEQLVSFMSPSSEFVTGAFIKVDDGQGGR